MFVFGNYEITFIDILEGLEHPDVGGAILYVWRDDPLYQPWMLWGYNEVD